MKPPGLSHCLTLFLSLLLFSGSVVSNFLVTTWTVAHQAFLAMGLSRQEYWNGLPFLRPGDLPDPGIKPTYPALQEDSLPLSQHGNPFLAFLHYFTPCH